MLFRSAHGCHPCAHGMLRFVLRGVVSGCMVYELYTCMVYGAVWLYGRYSGDLGGDVHVSLVSVRARVLGGNNCARMGTYEETVRA